MELEIVGFFGSDVVRLGIAFLGVVVFTCGMLSIYRLVSDFWPAKVIGFGLFIVTVAIVSSRIATWIDQKPEMALGVLGGLWVVCWAIGALIMVVLIFLSSLPDRTYQQRQTIAHRAKIIGRSVGGYLNRFAKSTKTWITEQIRARRSSIPTRADVLGKIPALLPAGEAPLSPSVEANESSGILDSQIQREVGSAPEDELANSFEI
jgi:hypothetical protein